MAAAGSFKQQCPSCDAMVLIKDRSLVGKKIECTSCKFKFAVEAPKAEGGEKEAPAAPAPTKAKPKPGAAPAAKKPGAAPAAPAGPAVKKKVGPRKPFDDEDDGPEVEAPKESSNKTVMMGVGLAVVCALILGVGLFFLFSGGDSNTGPVGPTGRKGGGPTTPQGPAVVAKEKEGLNTNLLPNDTQVVFNVRVNGPVERAAFYTPGAFSAERIKEKLGLKADAVEGVLVGLNVKKHWVFAVVRTNKDRPVDENALKQALALTPGPGSPVKKHEYFVMPPSTWLNNLERTALEAVPLFGAPTGDVAPRQLAVCVLDKNTLIVADPAPLREFLDAEAAPKALSQAAADAGGKKGAEDGGRYLTVAPALKAALDRAEGKKPPLLSVAWNMDALKDDLPKAQTTLKKLGGDSVVRAAGVPVDALATRLDEVRAGALAVRVEKTAVIALDLEVKDETTAKFYQDTLKDVAERLADVPQVAALPYRLDILGKSVGAKVESGPGLTVTAQAEGKAWLLTVDARGSGSANAAVEKELQPLMVLLRVASDMAAGETRVFDLAAATQAMVKENKNQFPRGTFERKAPGQRLGRPYLPNERVGWMPQLLPHLGYKSIYDNILFDTSWKDEQNAKMGQIPVPAFLAAGAPPDTWIARVRDAEGHELFYGATHFVGVAGVGPEAAEYKEDNAKAGIFGYDRSTPLDAIKNGTGNTIMMVQVPPDVPRPWIAGGGATVMGVPEKESLKPFLSATRDGKKGTYALMADGAVRFLPADLPDDVFKSMCTINGPGKVDLDKTILIPPAGPAVLKTKE